MPSDTSWPGKAGSQLAQVSISWVGWLVRLMVLLLLSGLGFDGLTLVLVVAVVVVAWRGRDGVLVDDVGCGSRCVCG